MSIVFSIMPRTATDNVMLFDKALSDSQVAALHIETNETFDLAHDDAGNLTVDHRGYHYDYDYENRLQRIYAIDVNGSTENNIARYTYDALGRRIELEDAVASTTTTYYYTHDPCPLSRYMPLDNDLPYSTRDQIESPGWVWQVLQEHNGSAFTNRYVYGNYIDEVLIMNDSTNDHYYAHNHLFSPVALLDNTGTIEERYEYNAYGQVSVLTNSDNDTNWFDDPDDTVLTSSQLG